jgi:UDP-N-acetylglucosamine 1-carboxyvinyltransferase
MGANIKVEGNTAIIVGVESITGAIVSAPDLRAGAALVIAGLVAEGFTIVEQVEYIERGYEDFESKMQGLGATMAKIDIEDEKAVQKFKLRVS